MKSSASQLTRRALARFAAVPLALSARAQPPAPAPASPPAASLGQFSSAGRQLARVKLARDIEPATRFEA